MSSSELTPQDAWDELVHKDDRTSPGEYPDHCLITFEELRDFMSRSRCISAENVAPSLHGPVSWRWRPRGATNWIYDPTKEWRKEHEGDIESEPLYAMSQPAHAVSGSGGPS